MQELGDPDVQPDNFTYSTLIKGIRPSDFYSGYSNYQELEKAFSLLAHMKKSKHIQPDEVLYNCLIDACTRFRDLGRAIEVFKLMQEDGIKPSAVTYGILIKAYGQENRIDDAFTVFL